jgi:hypothetical protein
LASASPDKLEFLTVGVNENRLTTNKLNNPRMEMILIFIFLNFTIICNC